MEDAETTTSDRALGISSPTIQHGHYLSARCRQPSRLYVPASSRRQGIRRSREQHMAEHCELGSFFRHTDYRDSRGIHAGNSQWEHASGGNQTGSVQHGTDVDQAALSSYSRVRDTLTVNESGDLVMRDYRIVVLRTPQHHARWAHRHQNLASYECVLPMYRHCSRGSGEAPHSVSGEYYSSRDRTTVHVVAIQPWSEIRIDFCRPLPIGEYLLFIVDESSP